ncbi:hypothetical protein B0J13DRAFT_648377 [Dactylonectria estremocensis]|uniref:Copper acquisition factor BIM1-like domain-containing protein n=1 Tax=Dactylonectria estremocensis TaxID=1079267 RepID=A0A9P9IJ60_9HYPO|nr:hypothetical protein B0J13DRAFT_648377 [Dactylonectria estremocensis]
MLKTNLLVLALATIAVSRPADDDETSSVTDDEMGPAAFMWPSDRVWSGDMDNKSPCGSSASAGNRTEFPLTGGALSLVGQDDYYNAKISISYSEDPTSNDDFTTLIEEQSIADLNPGHTCIDTGDLTGSASAGGKATFQIIYKADWDAPHNQTFYACADVVFVDESDFDVTIPCFNATEPGQDDKAAGATVNPTSTATWRAEDDDDSSDSSDSSSTASSSKSTSTHGSTKLDTSEDSGSKKLGGGAIAGIVVGSVAGVGLILAGAFLLWRRRQQKARTERIARMENSARSHEFATNKNSTSQNSVQLQDMP